MVNFQFETEMVLFESGWVCSGICNFMEHKTLSFNVLETIHKISTELFESELNPETTRICINSSRYATGQTQTALSLGCVCGDCASSLTTNRNVVVF